MLKKNNIVDIIAPASAAKYNIQNIENFFLNLGLVARIPRDLIDENSYYLANTDQYRLDHLKKSLYADDSSVIWCLRGGYGSMILIPELMKLTPPVKPKIFIGFSDITALHIFFNQEWGWSTIHGRMIGELSENYDDNLLESWKRFLFKQEKMRYILKPMNELAKEPSSLISKIIGGNLCMVENSLGTNWQIKPRGKILFLEEVNEKPYQIDRSLEHLKQAGIFEGVLAVILGAFNCENQSQESIFYSLSRFVDKANIPVLSISNIGHNVENPPLILGSNINLTLGANPLLLC